jgi:hypothetical protein
MHFHVMAAAASLDSWAKVRKGAVRLEEKQLYTKGTQKKN